MYLIILCIFIIQTSIQGQIVSDWQVLGSSCWWCHIFNFLNSFLLLVTGKGTSQGVTTTDWDQDGGLGMLIFPL